MNRALLAALLSASAAVHAQAPACASWGKPGKLLYADDFRGGLGQWVAEYARPNSSVGADGGKLVIDAAGGATVWLRHKLSGNVLISYRRKVIMERGRNDRLSDLNNFWMASDPANPNLFTRGGAFSEYDGLSMYYTGMGGNRNTTTRFRRYGGGDRVLLSDLTDAAHLLQANRDYAIQIAVYHGCTRMLVDGKPYFSYADPAPLREGYFGLRTTQSRHQVADFEVRQLDAEE